MPYTAQDHIDSFLDTYRGCSPTLALKWLNEVDEKVLAAIPLRKSRVSLPMLEGVFEYGYDETILKIWNLQYYENAFMSGVLKPTNTDKLDIDVPTWQMHANGTVWEWYIQSDMDGGQFGVSPPPDVSTLLVTGATVASPCVLTVNRAHGFTDGARVRPSEILGTTTANGLFYAKSLTATTFAIYSDEALTLPVAGVGVYTGGGIVAGPGSPKFVLECSQRRVLTAVSTMPSNNTIKELYSDGMAARWAKIKDPANYEARLKWFNDSLAEQWNGRIHTQGQAQVEITMFRQRKDFRNRGIRR